MNTMSEDPHLLADLARRSMYGYEHMEAAIARLRAAVSFDVDAVLDSLRHKEQGEDPALVIDALTSIGRALSRPDLCDYFAEREAWRVVRPETIRKCAELTMTREEVR